MLKEIWKDIPGYEGRYQVSNLGRVKSLNYKRTGTAQILKPANSLGYRVVNLCKHGSGKMFGIHRLVALVFIPNPLKLSVINHKDENRANNVTSNLEWCSKSYNATYGTSPAKIAAARSRPVLQYTKDGKFVREFSSLLEADKFFGCGGRSVQSSISQCCKGKIKSCRGFVWRFKD